MPTECEGSVVATTEQQLPQQQQQSEKQDADILQKDLNAKMEDKDFDGEMSTSQTSTTSSTGTPTNGHSGSNNGNGVGKKVPIISPDPTAYVAKARVTRPTPPPPSYNPMQFVQIKPCNLYQTAQEQLKKAEEVKKIKEIKKEEPEDWQNNLDNWKSSRRKRVEHIIDRVVEVKKLELEEHDRSRRKSKTFSEMIEERGERGVRGRVKLASLAVYNEDESNDLSDLGIGTSSASGKSSQSEDYDNNSVLSDNAELDKAIFESNHKPNSITREYISSPGYDTSSSTAPGSSPDPCEYTYEGAIQDYKQRVSRATAAGAGAAYKLNSSVAGANNNNKATASALRESTPDRINNGVTETYPTRRGSKIEDRLIGFEVTSPSDSQEGVEKSKVDLPKIDISKRKEIFESANQSEIKSLGNGGATPGPVPKVTLRDRFKVDEQATAGAAGKSQAQESTLKREVKRLSGDITSIRDRMQSLEQQNLVNSSNGGTKSSTAKIVDIPVPPLKDRLSSLQNAVTKEDVKKPPVALVDARQLEIMKTEEETAKQRMKQLEKEQPIKQLGATIEETTPVEPAVDRDDSGIHTADDIDTDAERMAEELQMQSEQEQQLNAAIAALALEEKQLEEAANAVNQIEAEFAELSHAPAATTNEPPCEMEFSINEALELALEAIDNESKLNINDTLATTISTTTTTTATRKLSIMSNAQGSYNNSNNTNNNSQHGPHSPSETPNKTDEEKELKSQQMNDEEHADDAASREALISQEPIYENISTASTRQVDAEAIIIPKTITNNQNHNQIVNNINQNQNSGKHMRNSNNNNNNNNNPLSKPTNNSNSNSNSNCNNHNNTNNNMQNLVDLTNAFANATSITNKTTTTTNTDLIATENEMATLNTIANTTSTSTTTTTNNNNHTAITTTNIATETVITSLEPQQQQQQQQQPTVETTTTTILPQPPQQQQQQITNHTSDPEPYYQVPKSVEPYYDAPKHLRPIPLYENIEIFYTGLENAALATSSGKMEPPKEKPPPPPIESPPPFDDVDSVDNNTDTWSSDNTYETISSRLPQNGLTGEHPSPPIKRMNSTKRIKKELRNKRSSFLGIDPNAMDDEDSYLELTVAPPPDMAQLLQEERRLEKQLYLKAGLCDSSDTGESRDSGVSENHSRQSSEHYTNSSEENDHHIESPPHSLKVSEVIYHNDSLLTAAQTPLLQTVKGNSAESWTESATVAAAATKSLTEATATATAKMISIEEKIREQEEVLRVERELLQLEQEELKRQRENLMLRESMARRELQHGAKMLMSANRRSLQDLNGVGASMSVPGSAMAYQAAMPHHPLSQTPLQQPHPAPALPPQQIYANVPNLQQQYYQMDTDYRKSMSDLQEFSKRLMLPPTPPTKPMRSMHVTTAAPAATVAASTVALPNGHVDIDYAARQRHSLNAQSYGGSLVKIATPTAAPRAQIYANHNYHHHQSAQNLSQLANVAGNNGNSSSGLGNGHAHAGNMSRNTLHALSATPKPKYTDGWVQVQNRKSYDTNLANDPAWLSAYQQKRKSMPEAYHAYNNHWLVQEAEQRRIAEQQRRTVSTGNTPIHQQNGIMAKASVSASASASAQSNGKPLPDSIIQTLTERVQSKGIGERKRFDNYSSNVDKSPLHAAAAYHHQQQQPQPHPQQLAHGTAAVSARRQHGDFSATANAVTALPPQASANTQQDKVLSVSGKKKCSHCGDELGRGAAMIIESLLLFYHINCFKCCVCHVQLGDGLNGTDVRVRNHKLHCQNCYSSDDGIKFSCV